ncbi:hypothetical protein N825_00440 [Skermanella stibiiresistens SB22]|uniref:Uncharacterized protein n=1 Tax=Skermanella stibiiresistens SB22 TaxID=1385369 RepID=W9HDI7_9PROT|nr:hypothetical protein N825_00440 [Skermanella stibiiresistens SB22]
MFVSDTKGDDAKESLTPEGIIPDGSQDRAMDLGGGTEWWSTGGN